VLLLNDISYKTFLTENSMTPAYTLLNTFFVAVIVVIVVFALTVTQLMVTGMQNRKESKDEVEEAEDE